MNKELEEMKAEYENVTVDENIKERLVEVMKKAQEDKKRAKVVKIMRGCSIAAAALAVMIVLPNTSASVAQAMGSIPVVGKLFEVVTFREYKVDEGNYQADVKVPQIEEDTAEAADATENTEEVKEETAKEIVNKSVEEYVDMLIAQIEADMAVDENGEGHEALDIDYDVVTDSANWFTLRVNVLQTQASAMQQYKFYHINKELDQVVTLGDLFAEGSDYVARISENIIKQMEEQMAADEGKMYFINSEEGYDEWDFKQIKEDQNFYFNEEGKLVIAFDEYEVAPGYMGAVDFTIEDDVIADILEMQPAK